MTSGLSDQDATDPRSGRLNSALAGAIMATDTIGHCLAVATVCFAGTIAAGVDLSLTLFLVGSLISTLALNMLSRFGVALGIAQDTSLAALVPALIYAGTLVDGSDTATIMTTVAVIGSAAILTGLAFFALGLFRLGRIVRMFPYPVAAGFLASSGLIIATIAFDVVAEAGGQNIGYIVFAPLILMALCLFLADVYIGGATSLIVIVFLAIALFYGVLYATGISVEEAVAAGFLQAREGDAGLKLSPALIGAVDWWVVLQVGPLLSAVVAINTLGFLLNSAGVELATRRTVDINRELRIAGGVNLLCGAFGSLASYLQSGATIVVSRFAVRRMSFLAGFSIMILSGALFAKDIVAIVPIFVAAALILFIGLVMLKAWLFDSYRRLVLSDWLIVVGIVLATALIGILPAIAFGFILALLRFALSYIELPLIRAETDLACRPSILDRSTEAQSYLRDVGGSVRILHLHGALFFGSVEQMNDRIRALAAEVEGLHAVILNLAGIQSFDSSACAAVETIDALAREKGVRVVLAAPPAPLLEVFERWGLRIDPLAVPGHGLRLGGDLDTVLEALETELLPPDMTEATPLTIRRILSNLSDGHPATDALVARFQPRQLHAGDTLIRAGDTSRDVFFVEQGRLGVWIPSPDAGRRLVRSLGPGAVFGEVAFLLSQERSADVVAETDAVVSVLSARAFDQIRADDPAAAEILTMALARSVSLKVLQTNRLVTQG